MCRPGDMADVVADDAAQLAEAVLATLGAILRLVAFARLAALSARVAQLFLALLQAREGVDDVPAHRLARDGGEEPAHGGAHSFRRRVHAHSSRCGRDRRHAVETSKAGERRPVPRDAWDSCAAGGASGRAERERVGTAADLNGGVTRVPILGGAGQGIRDKFEVADPIFSASVSGRHCGTRGAPFTFRYHPQYFSPAAIKLEG